MIHRSVYLLWQTIGKHGELKCAQSTKRFVYVAPVKTYSISLAVLANCNWIHQDHYITTSSLHHSLLTGWIYNLTQYLHTNSIVCPWCDLQQRCHFSRCMSFFFCMGDISDILLLHTHFHGKGHFVQLLCLTRVKNKVYCR